MQPTEYYIVVLAELGNGLNAVLEYSERHNVSSVGVMRDSDIANYHEPVDLEPWFWPQCLNVITDSWYL